MVTDWWNSQLTKHTPYKVFPLLTRTAAHFEDYTHDSHFALFCCGYATFDYTHILRDYFTDTGTIMQGWF